MIPSYSDIRQLGHREVADIFDGMIAIQEKVDGSQLSFLWDETGEQLLMRSKGQQIDITNADKMFSIAITEVQGLDLTPGYVYRGEYLRTPKHNTLKYDRVPNKHIILFDIEVGAGTGYYLPPHVVWSEAVRLGLEAVPTFFYGRGSSEALVAVITDDFMKRTSVLGGPQVEGVVIKNYNRLTPDHKVAMAKFVSAEFKEKHQTDWKDRNPSGNDFIEILAATYRHEGRWRKAIQHLRDNGQLQVDPRDIGPLMREIVEDIERECGDEIRDALWNHFWKTLKKKATVGFPEWYKQQLFDNAYPSAA